MDTNPLPTQDDENSDSGQVTHYIVRITSHEKFTFDELHGFIKEEHDIYSYVIGRELVPQEHFHLVLTVDDLKSEQDVRDIIKAFLVPLWQNDGKLPRGFGNKQYNLQLAEDVDLSITYAVKMGDFVFENWDEEYIEACRAKSFEKKKPSNFKVEYMELSKEFQENPDIDIREFMIRLCNLKAKYGQIINMSHIYGSALSAQLLRNPELTEDYVENYLYKL